MRPVCTSSPVRPSLATLLLALQLLAHGPGTTRAQEALCPLCIDNVEATVTTMICETLAAAADLLTNDTYTEEICAGIQYRGVTAGCCDAPPTFCNLCEQGGRLPEPDLKVSALTCSQIGGVASFFGNATCEVYQATYGVYCGCENPLASENACRICGDDVPLEHRTLVPASKFQNTAEAPAKRFCGALEFFSQFSTDPLPGCADYQAEFGASCCGAGGGGVDDGSTEAPGGSVAARPTLAPVTAPSGTAPITASGGNVTTKAPAAASSTNGTTPVATPVASPLAPAPVATPVVTTGATPLPGTALTPPASAATTGWHTWAVGTIVTALVGWTMLVN
jgi:hypothetical protein